MGAKAEVSGHKAACRRLYEHYRENGICVNCGGAWSLAGHVLCGDCTKKAERSQKRFDPDGSKKRDRMTKLREERRSKNLCLDCGAKTDGVHRRCEKCLKAQRERTQLSTIRKRMKEGLI